MKRSLLFISVLIAISFSSTVFAVDVLPEEVTSGETSATQPTPTSGSTPGNTTSSASRPSYCFIAAGDAIGTCSDTHQLCERNRDVYISKGGLVPDQTKRCDLQSDTDDVYPRYCAGVAGMNPDVCFETRDDCKSAYRNLNQRDERSFPLRDLEGENATRCLKVEKDDPSKTYTLENPIDGIDNVFQLIDRIVGIIVKIALPIAFAIIVWTGFKFVIAQGNPEKLSSAKRTLKFLVIGLCLLLGAKLLTNILASTVYQILGR